MARSDEEDRVGVLDILTESRADLLAHDLKLDDLARNHSNGCVAPHICVSRQAEDRKAA